jgi:hypothetical protein
MRWRGNCRGVAVEADDTAPGSGPRYSESNQENDPVANAEVHRPWAYGGAKIIRAARQNQSRSKFAPGLMKATTLWLNQP